METQTFKILEDFFFLRFVWFFNACYNTRVFLMHEIKIKSFKNYIINITNTKRDINENGTYRI